MSSAGSRQNVRLFIEGQEVPFQNASITSQEGEATAAAIYLVPLSGIKEIKARTQVHIFVQDTKSFPDANFYLAFEGEVVGRILGKRQDSRVFGIMAVDYSSYWEDAKTYVVSPNFVLGKVEDVVTFQDAPINQQIKALGGVAFQTSATSNTRSIEIMLASGNKDLAKGVVSVVNKVATANQFYAAAFQRLNITQRINLFSGGNLQAFLQELQIEGWLQDFVGKFGGISSLRDMLYGVMNLVFHTFISVPFPAKIPSKTTPGTNTLSQFLFVPDAYTLPAPMCNVVFPNQQRDYEFKDDFRKAPTRYMFRASMPLMSGTGVTFPQYPSYFFPTSFSDYMFGKHTATQTETDSELGPSTLLTDPVTGNSYADVFYNNPNTKAVGTAFGVTLREADYISNEESLKGIYLEMDTFMPSYTALVKGASAAARTSFIQAVGTYLFYKKRFSARQTSVDLLFNPYLVPGFNGLFLDDSEAGQSFQAKIQSLVHTLSNDGCSTSVSLAYGRDFDEVDDVTGGSGDPPVAPWFDPTIFGIVDTDNTYFDQETQYLVKLGAMDKEEADARGDIDNPTVFPNLNKFYQALLGVNSVTNYTAPSGTPSKNASPQPVLVSTWGATEWLLYQYEQVMDNPDAVDAKVRQLTARPMMNILEAFNFIRAQPAGYNGNVRFQLPIEFASFVAITKSNLPKGQSIDLPGRFDGTGYSDQAAIALRRSILPDYIQLLKTQVGFRG